MSEIVMVKGDTTVFDVAMTRLNLLTEQEEPVPLAGAKAWFTAKKNTRDADINAVIAKDSVSNPSQVIITPTTGIIRITIIPEDTVGYTGSWLYYDVQVREADGTVTTIQSGSLELLKHSTIGIL
jgi:hypothetical protein